MSLAQLPINVWDEVLYLVGSTKDLLSLALTCQTFKELIIPNHLEYRYIRCDLRRSEVWKALAARPCLARAVRTVNLVYEPVENIHLPRVFGQNKKKYNSSVTKRHIAVFQTALRHMAFLSQLVWKQNRCPFEGISAISDALTSTVSPHYFKVLSIDFNWINDFGNERLRAGFDKLSVWNLSALTKVVLHNAGPAALQMLLRCPDIEALSLTELPNTLALQLLQSANWKKLQHLRLETADSSPACKEDISEDSTSFFNRHANLETLVFAMTDVREVGPLPPCCLPRLSSIGWESAMDLEYEVTDFLSPGILTHLVHWQCPINNIDINAVPQMDQLESLRLIVYGMLPQDFNPFLQRTPNLKKIDIIVEDEILEPYMQERLIRSFGQCSKLTHIFGTVSLDEADEEDALDILEELSELPHLQYVQFLHWGKADYVKLDRNESGEYTGHHSVTLEEAGGSSENWGGFFFHL